MRWIRRVLIGVLALVVVVAGWGFFLSRRSFPTIDGEVEVEGLQAAVEVIRDEDGVPHIYASTVQDLFFAEGYVHAQDRFWQMDFWRHIGAGRLAEMFGQPQAETDVFLRTLGFERIAEQEYINASDEVQAILDSYAAGVNAYLGEHSGSALSFEYSILGLQGGGYEPAPWTPVNTLTWVKVMAWDLRANLDEEIARAVLSQTLPRDRVEQLFPPYPLDHPVIAPTSEIEPAAPPQTQATDVNPVLYQDLSDAITAVEGVTGRWFSGIGSNSWVVSGRRTASGMPLLANDPHLGIQMPSIWYEVGLHCKFITSSCDWDVAGFSFAGAPGVVIGHNDTVAWGFTNEGPDSMDLFIERVNPANRDQYMVDGAWKDMDVRTETIEIAGGEPIDIIVRTTRHGPVISGRFGAADELTPGPGAVEVPTDHVLALRWTALDPSTVLEALLGFNKARSLDQFRQAARKFDIAPQNVVYADTGGTIAYIATGDIPVRTAGDGRYPVPGWNSQFEWKGFIPTDDLPVMVDPAKGYIVTANQPVADAGYPRFIGIDHAYGFRAQRISKLLDSQTRATVESMQAIQFDNRDTSAETVVPALLGLTSADGRIATIQGLLLAFSQADRPYQMRADSAGAAAYGAVWRHLLSDIFDDELPERYWAGGNGRYFQVVENLLSRPDSPWWDDATTIGTERRDDILERAMVEAYEELSDLMGGDADSWAWGDIHQASFENQSLGQSGVGPIEAIFNRGGIPVSGGSAIVNATGWIAHEGYDVVAIPSMRMVVDLAELSASQAINATGQSGHAYHRHYDDMVERWASGQYHPMRWTREQVQESAEGTLLMVPPGSSG